MSYVLQIWETPIPSTVQEAADINKQLQDQEGPQNPKFIALANQLTKRYPCISQLTGEEEGYEEVVWSDGPLDGETSNPVYGVGITSNHIAEVLPFVVQTAQSLGLTVYDEQAGQTHLPSGQLLTIPGQAPVKIEEPEEDPEYIKSAAHSQKVLMQHVTSYFKSHGFIYDKVRQEFIKIQDGFYHSIAVGGGGYYIGFGSYVCITANLAPVMHLEFVNLQKPVPAYMLLFSELQRVYPDAQPPFEHLGHISVRKVSDIRTAASRVMAYYDKTYMPLIRSICSFQDIEHYLQLPSDQTPFAKSRSIPIVKMLVSRITKSRDLDATVDDARAEFAGEYSQYIHEFDKTVEYIKLEKAQNKT
jgi:hypothetical protein